MLGLSLMDYLTAEPFIIVVFVSFHEGSEKHSTLYFPVF